MRLRLPFLDAPATLVWAEALDDGNPNRKVPHRDKVVTLAAPFTGEPKELARAEHRFGGLTWGEKGLALLTDFDRESRHRRTFAIDANAADQKPRLIWDRPSRTATATPARRSSKPPAVGLPGAPAGRRRHLPQRRRRVAQGQPAVPRPLQPEVTQGRATVPVRRGILRNGRAVDAGRPDVFDAARVADVAAELPHPPGGARRVPASSPTSTPPPSCARSPAS
ncbi:MAG: hypothetical protein U0797_28890 [Gemmataceae bacterium]